MPLSYMKIPGGKRSEIRRKLAYRRIFDRYQRGTKTFDTNII